MECSWCEFRKLAVLWFDQGHLGQSLGRHPITQNAISGEEPLKRALGPRALGGFPFEQSLEVPIGVGPNWEQLVQLALPGRATLGATAWGKGLQVRGQSTQEANWSGYFRQQVVWQVFVCFHLFSSPVPPSTSWIGRGNVEDWGMLSYNTGEWKKQRILVHPQVRGQHLENCLRSWIGP